MAAHFHWGPPSQHQQHQQHQQQPLSLQLEHHYDLVTGSYDIAPADPLRHAPEQSPRNPQQFPAPAYSQTPYTPQDFSFRSNNGGIGQATSSTLTVQHTPSTEARVYGGMTAFPTTYDHSMVPLTPNPPSAFHSYTANDARYNAAGVGVTPYGLQQLSSPEAMSSPEYGSKRHRPERDDPDSDGEEDEGELTNPNGDASKRKALGACQHCKGLKVRCEFKNDPFTCKRCQKGGHVCEIPHRKKRKAPPKRELLMKEIREQSSVIEDLMSKLELANAAAAQGSNVSGGGAPASSPLSARGLSLVGDDGGADVPRPDVQAWIAKARESFRAFDGLIGVAPTLAFEEHDSELDGAEEEDELDDEDEVYGDPGSDEVGRIAVEAEEDFDMAIGVGSPGGHSSYSRRTGAQKAHAPLPTVAAPYGLIARMRMQTGQRSRSPSAEPESYGVADPSYFDAGGSEIDASMKAPGQQVPHIFARGIVTAKEVEELFKIYFDNMNLSCSLLDPVLYTAKNTYVRSPFLFTVICAIASRFHPRKDLYDELMKFAQLAAGTALISATKTVDVVAAYILLSLYPVPMRRWEDDRTWLYIGCAIRVATDINLHRPRNVKPRDEAHARELLNRTRLWINCHNLDRSTSSWHGKACTLNNADYIATHCGAWYNASAYNVPNFDIHLAAYNAELRVMREWSSIIYSDPQHPTGLNKRLDISKIVSDMDDKLVGLEKEWAQRLDAETNHNDPQNRFRCCLIRLAYSYARLVLLSFGFQHAGRNSQEENPFFRRCATVACDLVKLFTQKMSAQKIYLRHAPEGQFVFITFAAAFLVKLLHAKYTTYLTKQERIDIRELVQGAIDLLGSPEVVVDDRHSPKLWSKFLEGLLSTPMAQIELSPSAFKTGSALPRRRSGRRNNRASGSAEQSTSPRSPPAASATDAQSPSSAATQQVSDPLVAPEVSREHRNALQMDFSDVDFNPAPLALDADFMQNMRAMEDAAIWKNMVLTTPGFHWMGGQTIDPGTQTHTINPDFLSINPVQTVFASY